MKIRSVALARLALCTALSLVPAPMFGQGSNFAANAGTTGTGTAAISRVVSAVDDTQRVTLRGNSHPLARPEFEAGLLSGSTVLHRMQMVLARSPEQEANLARLVDAQQDQSNAAAYHQWLTPQSFGAAFGPSDRDLAALTSWLGNQGFKNVRVNDGRTVVEFDGNAAVVQSAFHTQMHRYLVQGQEYLANASDPQIPAALMPIVGGFASLNNFPHHAANHLAGSFTKDTKTGAVTPQISPAAATPRTTSPRFTVAASGQTYYAITPYDFAAIYNVLPLWNASAPVDGTGQTIAVVGQSDLNPVDFVNFRKLFNLPIGSTNTPSGTQYLNIIYNGPNPGITGDEAEADIDTQWTAAVAKGATIDYVASQATEVSSGSDLSAAYIVNNNLASVLSDSYASCEFSNGTSGNLFYKTLWEQAAAQGITVVVASGNVGSAGCEVPPGPAVDAYAKTGLAVNGLASTAYNVAVGGTDFFLPNGGGSYFSTTNNPTTQASALGYIPETVWNDSCTNASLGTTPAYSGQSPEVICNSAAAAAIPPQTLGTPPPLLTVAGAGGGASSCIQSDSVNLSSCSGGYPKPSWQTGSGVPADGVRDLPDVSLFSSNGFFGAFYVVCQQSKNVDGNACSLASPTYDFQGYGGTSVAAPAFAGVMALVNQRTAARQGVANYTLYRLATNQTSAGTGCNATGAPSASCVFNDTTTGTNAQPCMTGSPNCTTSAAGDAYGILGGYSAKPGYDLASGLGSINAANLVNSWTSVKFSATTTSLSLSPATIVHGSAVTANVTVSAVSGTPTGDVSVIASAGTGVQTKGTLSATGTFTGAFSTFPGGNYSVTAHYPGDGTFGASDSNVVALNVSPEPSTTRLQAIMVQTFPNHQVSTVSTMPYGATFFIRADVAGVSGQGSATGYVNINDGVGPLDSGVFLLNSSGYTEAQTNSLVPGLHTFTASYVGDPSFNPSASTGASLTITPGITAATITSSTANVSAGSIITLTGGVTTTGFGHDVPTGYITFLSSGKVLGTSLLKIGNDPVSPYDYAVAVITIPASLLPIGDDTITVAYAGDANYAAVTSSPTAVKVTDSTLSSTVTTSTATPASVPIGGALTFSAAIALGTPSAPATGTVQFIVDGQNVGKPVVTTGSTAGGSASLIGTATGYKIGTHKLTATYSGDASYKSSISDPVLFTVTPPANAGLQTVVVAPTTVIQGTTILVTTSVGAVSTTPTGTTQLLVDGNFIGNQIPLLGGSATLPLETLTLQVGLHVVTVRYFGDSVYNSSYSDSTSVIVIAPGATPSTLALTGVPATVVTNTAFIYNAIVSPSNPTPTGILQVTVDNGIPSAPIQFASNGQTLSLSTVGLALGQHTLSVFYSGDSVYRFSSSPTETFSVVVAPPPLPPAPPPPVSPPPGPVPSFTLTPTTATATAIGGAGPSAPITFTVTPINGFSSPITFVCTGLPATGTCVFAPATVQIAGTAASTTSLSFTIKVGQSELEPFHLRRILPLGGGIAFAGTLLLWLPRRRLRLRSALLACVAVSLLAGISGCGSGYYPGPYQVTVSAVGGGVAQTAIVTLNVQ